MKLLPPTEEIPVEIPEATEEVTSPEAIIAAKREEGIKAIKLLTIAGDSFVDTLSDALGLIEKQEEKYPALALTALLVGSESMINGLVELMHKGVHLGLEETDGHTGSGDQASQSNRKTGRTGAGATSGRKTGRRGAGRDRKAPAGTGRQRKALPRHPTPAEHRANLRAAAKQSRTARKTGRTSGRKGAVKTSRKRR